MNKIYKKDQRYTVKEVIIPYADENHPIWPGNGNYIYITGVIDKGNISSDDMIYYTYKGIISSDDMICYTYKDREYVSPRCELDQKLEDVFCLPNGHLAIAIGNNIVITD
jgi:hypothetical protein